MRCHEAGNARKDSRRILQEPFCVSRYYVQGCRTILSVRKFSLSCQAWCAGRQNQVHSPSSSIFPTRNGCITDDALLTRNITVVPVCNNSAL